LAPELVALHQVNSLKSQTSTGRKFKLCTFDERWNWNFDNAM